MTARSSQRRERWARWMREAARARRRRQMRKRHHCCRYSAATKKVRRWTCWKTIIFARREISG